MVYMNGSKKARSQSSIMNKTNVFGHMGGIVSNVGVSTATRNAVRSKATTTNKIPVDPTAGYQYMLDNNLLSKNPACAGGVGRTKNISMCFN